MSITAGTKFGRYEIRSQIGAGGMGEVYRASDPKIGRDVAIKVGGEQRRLPDRHRAELGVGARTRGAVKWIMKNVRAGLKK